MNKYETKYDFELDEIQLAQGIWFSSDFGLVLENDKSEIFQIFMCDQRIDDEPQWSGLCDAIKKHWRNEYNEMTPEDRRAI